MSGSARWVAAGVLLLALGCGNSREERRMDRIRAICDALVGKTVRQAEIELNEVPILSRGSFDAACQPDYTSLSGNDVCAYDGSTDFCLLGWSYYLNDPNACGPNGCFYGCVIRSSRADLEAGLQNGDEAAPICASRFVSGQPLPVIY